MIALAPPQDLGQRVEQRAEFLYAEHHQRICRQTDRLFAALLIFQYLAGILTAIWISPRTWAGIDWNTHSHVWAAAGLGALIISLPLLLAYRLPGSLLTRHVIAVGQMLTSSLLIHLMGGRIETHFHVFGSLAFVAFYRDWKVLVTATVVVAVDHLLRGLLWPESVYGIAAAGVIRTLEHAGWVIFEDVFLVWSCVRSCREMREIALRRAELEATNEIVDAQVQERTAELADSRKSLEAQTRDLELKNMELWRLKQEADQASTAKSQFLANMSHELRTPMNAIIGYSEMLQEECDEQGHADYVPDLLKIRSAGKHLLGLINDILDLSKIEAGKMELFLEDVDVQGLVAEAVDTVSPLMLKRSNSFHATVSDRLPRARLDSTKIRQCLFNLLSNASKFTENGSIRLNVQPARRSGQEWLEMEVTDTGIGMSEEQRNRIFDAFVQAEGSTTRRFGGTGLGLTITRHFCQMHGGVLRVDSEQGHGSRFTMCLPLQPAENCSERSRQLPIPTVEAEQRPIRHDNHVVVVDDDENVRDLMLRILRKSGYHVTVVSSGAEALPLVKRVQPMAVILDVMMPEMDGWAVLTALKSDSLTADIPVVMVTMADNAEMGYALGAADYMVKPPDRFRLEKVLGKFRKEHERFEVLVVDDDHDCREMVVRLAEKAGCGVTQAIHGRDALDKLEQSRPDLILLDLMMPEMDGFEFLKHLEELQLQPEIPVIVLTARELSRDERAVLQGRVVSVRNKAGCSRTELLETINGYIERSNLEVSGEVCS